ncbi:hypothetical protein B0H19DRAFT_1273970 [Mycena capillaripes]|nr:hypothetical protein B0H19DRAFT_1273970 [Mycena capillaripes]
MLSMTLLDNTIRPQARISLDSFARTNCVRLPLHATSYGGDYAHAGVRKDLRSRSGLCAPAEVKETFPVIVLGLIRVFLIKGIEYPEHETEYGAHWNFFITLALLPVLQVLLHPLIRVVPASLLGVGVGILHQFALSVVGLKRYVRTAPRTNLISANKERTSPPSQVYLPLPVHSSPRRDARPPALPAFRRLTTSHSTPAELSAPRQNHKSVIELASYAIADLPYILWIAAFNATSVLGYLVLDMVFFPAPGAAAKRSTPAATPPMIPE